MMTQHTPLSLTVLASGSSGNCYVVHGEGGSILLDAGLSARRIVQAMEAEGLDPSGLDGMVITHEHGDHIRGVRVLAKQLHIPVFMTRGTLTTARDDLSAADIRTVASGDEVSIGGLGVRVFRTEHDAAEPVGFAFEDQHGCRLGVMTDTGHVTDSAAAALDGCHVLGIESNHDVETLNRGPYPWFLKERILSSRGHLSNADAGAALVALASPALRHVVALHLSDTNNSAELAHTALSGAIAESECTPSLTVFVQGSCPSCVS